MTFEILEHDRKGTRHSYTVKGPDGWTLEDLPPYMAKITKQSKNFELIRNTIISDKRWSGNEASITLEKTVIPYINKLIVIDRGVGTQMINKYIHSIEETLEEL